MSKHHIALIVPCLGSISPELSGFLSMAKSVNFDERAQYRFTIKYVEGIRPVHKARNVIADEFLRTDAVRLWMIDSDVIPAGNSMELLNVHADIAVSLVPLFGKFSGQAEPEFQWGIYQKSADGYAPAKVYESSIRPVDAASTGMMLIRRRVLEDREMKIPFEETSGPDGERLMGSDIGFCERAKRAGFTLKAHHGIKCDHRKTVRLGEVMSWAQKVYQAGYVAAGGADAA